MPQINRAGRRYLVVLPLILAGIAFADTKLTVHELMVSAITPATNTLWAVDSPANDSDWQALDDAAVVIIAASSLIADGAAGPSDKEWAENPEWQAYVATMLGAAEDARVAVKSRDLDALLQANDDIYPPCEECHQAFHPGMQ